MVIFYILKRTETLINKIRDIFGIVNKFFLHLMYLLLKIIYACIAYRKAFWEAIFRLKRTTFWIILATFY